MTQKAVGYTSRNSLRGKSNTLGLRHDRDKDFTVRITEVAMSRNLEV